MEWGDVNMNKRTETTRIQTIVIGGGQAGLSVGYHLARRGLPFLILDANARIGDAWRNRWDSLRLFTPARYAGLAGMPFRARGRQFSRQGPGCGLHGKYAQRFRLPVRNGVKVDRLWQEGGRFVMAAGSQLFESENVVVAMANYQVPSIPDFARDLAPGIRATALPSVSQRFATTAGGSADRGSGQLWRRYRDRGGADASDLDFREGVGVHSFPDRKFRGRNFRVRLVRFVGHHVLSAGTPIGRRFPKLLHKASPLVRVKPKDLVDAGIERVPRTVAVKDGLPRLEDGRTLDVQNVIWCTGTGTTFPGSTCPS